MYPDSALSAGQLAIIAVVAVVSLAVWLTNGSRELSAAW
jgi:hypothetical protein